MLKTLKFRALRADQSAKFWSRKTLGALNFLSSKILGAPLPYSAAWLNGTNVGLANYQLIQHYNSKNNLTTLVEKLGDELPNCTYNIL